MSSSIPSSPSPPPSTLTSSSASPSSLTLSKQLLRSNITSILCGLSSSNIDEQSRLLSSFLLSHPIFSSSNTILLYNSINKSDLSNSNTTNSNNTTNNTNNTNNNTDNRNNNSNNTTTNNNNNNTAVQGEFQTRYLIEGFYLQHKQLFFPLCLSSIKNGSLMEFFEWNLLMDGPQRPPNCWKKNKWGIAEPSRDTIDKRKKIEEFEFNNNNNNNNNSNNDNQRNDSGIEGKPETNNNDKIKSNNNNDDLIIVIVPGVAFDLFGGRLGHGGGYYDRWIHRLRQSGRHLLLIAIGLREQIIIDKDIPMGENDQRMDYLFYLNNDNQLIEIKITK